MNQTHLELRVLADKVGDLTVKSLNGRDHYVIPSIIIKQGVMWASNASHPALALAEEFGIFPNGWDGRPIVYNHPKINGQPVSANRPEGWEQEVIGQLFDSALVNGDKLRTNLWVDKEKMPDKILKALQNEESLEVSTGLYCLEEETSGDYNGKSYEVIWRHIVPDHLAILEPGSVGACSNADGCGAPRINQVYTESDMSKTPETKPAATGTPVVATNSKCSCGEPAQLSKKSPEEIRKITDNLLSTLGIKIELRVNELADMDKRDALIAALVQVVTGSCYILAVYPNKVVYASLDYDTYEWGTYERTYTIAEGGSITIGSEAVKVRPETQFVPLVVTVNNQEIKGVTMSNKAEEVKANEAAAGSPVVAAATTTTTTTAEAPAKAKTLTELKALASPEVASQIDAMVKANEARQTILINGLKDKVGLSEDELKVMPLETLEKMHTKINAVGASAARTEAADFSGAGGGAPTANAEGDRFTPPMPVFPLPAAKQ